jgi:hypothetical protein
MTAAISPDLGQLARDVLDSVRYVVLATVDADGRTRTSPVYFTPYRYEELYWVSYADTHHSANLVRDARLSGVVFDSTRPPGQSSAVYVTGTARELSSADLDEHLPRAFDPEGRGGRRFTHGEVSDDDGLRLWVLHVAQWEVHVPAGHPTLGTGHDRRVAVDPRPGHG